MLRNFVISLVFTSFVTLPVVSIASSNVNFDLALANNSPASKINLTKRHGWLADLSVMPSLEEIDELSLQVDAVMQADKDKRCTAINPRLRKMILLHFAIYQHMLNNRSIYFRKNDLRRWSKMFAILLKESSGDPTNVTSMTGRTFTTYRVKTDLDRWRKIVKLEEKRIPFNSQTNFGLTQISVDRLFVALEFSKRPLYLRGRKLKLNTATAVRRLVWFYQDFAQGRLTQEQDRIHNDEQGSPEYATRYSFGGSMALLLCGTNYMFYEGYHQKTDGQAKLSEAMSSIAYCKIGDDSGYGRTEEHQKCFAKWITLCPTLNFDIAMLTPLSYFATRNARPVCESSFEALLVSKNQATKHSKKLKRSKHIKQEKNEQNTVTTEPTEQKKSPGYHVRQILNAVGGFISNLFGGSKQ